MGKLFDRLVYDYFNTPNFLTDKDGNYINASVKKDFCKYKEGDRIKLRFDFIDERIYIDGKEIFPKF